MGVERLLFNQTLLQDPRPAAPFKQKVAQPNQPNHENLKLGPLQRIQDMRAQYVDWCRKSKINGANRLWTAKILKPKSGEYPSVLQKVMKGAAARVLVHWCAGVSHAHASNTNSEKDWYEPRFLTLHIQCYACCICC